MYLFSDLQHIYSVFTADLQHIYSRFTAYLQHIYSIFTADLQRIFSVFVHCVREKPSTNLYHLALCPCMW